MSKLHTIALLLLLSSGALAQTTPPAGTKGAEAVFVESIPKPGGKTIAVVVGVSDYHDDGIRDLQYADRDAREFCAFLRSPTGGQVPDAQIRLLDNKKATLAGIQAALEWLFSETEKGDVAIFYFSGHGDVESRNDREKGYLLVHDTPKNNYRLNAIDVDYFNENTVGRLSAKGAKVVVILDACHAGTLAGEGVGGREATAMELMKRFSSEVKLLSCQPYELSQEGPRWGGGRGVFSYYLIEGLKGSANEDADDRRVDLYELETYLLRQIHKATNKSQHPDVFGGNKREALFWTDEGLATELRAKAQQAVRQDLETSLLNTATKLDSRRRYQRFTEALDRGALLEPAGDCGRSWYDSLMTDLDLVPLRGLIQEKWVVALSDPVQQALRAYLDTDPEELAHREQFDPLYGRFAAYLGQAAAALGPLDPRYRPARAKQYYFEGLADRLRAEQAGGDTTLYRSALAKQDSALALENQAAYIYNELGFLSLALGAYGRGVDHLEKAVALAPTWAIPYNNLATEYKRRDSFELAQRFYRKALALKPGFASAWSNLGNLYAALEQPDSAEVMYRRAIAQSPEQKDYYFYLGLLLGGIEGRQREAVPLFRNSLRLDSTYAEAWFELANAQDALNQPAEAEAGYRKATSLRPDYAAAHLNLGIHYYHRKKFRDAEAALKKALAADPSLLQAYASLITVYDGQWDKTDSLLRTAPLEYNDKVVIVRDVGLGWLQKKAKDKARGLFERTAALAPANPAGDYLMTLYFTATGAPDKALASLESCLKKAKAAGISYLELVESDEQLTRLRGYKGYPELKKTYSPNH